MSQLAAATAALTEHSTFYDYDERGWYCRCDLYRRHPHLPAALEHQAAAVLAAIDDPDRASKSPQPERYGHGGPADPWSASGSTPFCPPRPDQRPASTRRKTTKERAR